MDRLMQLASRKSGSYIIEKKNNESRKRSGSFISNALIEKSQADSSEDKTELFYCMVPGKLPLSVLKCSIDSIRAKLIPVTCFLEFVCHYSFVCSNPEIIELHLTSKKRGYLAALQLYHQLYYALQTGKPVLIMKNQTACIVHSLKIKKHIGDPNIILT